MGSCLSADGRNSLPNSPTSPSPKWKQKRNSKKKPGMRNTSKWEDQLHRIPGRMFLSGATDLASLCTQQGKKGTNQDAMIVWENFCSRMDTVFCGVFDGHGPYGHMVAKRVRDSLPLRLSANWEVGIGRKDGFRESDSARESMNSDETASLCIDDEPGDYLDVEEKEKLQQISALKESFLKAFRVMDKELRVHPNVDCFCSGTTAVTLVKQGQDLVIGNIGDSRAILGTRDQDDSLIAVQLTEDLKPNLPREAERIRRCKGRVFALKGEPDVARVWLPNTDGPGLAMARAFGDFCLKNYGVISVPDISYRRLSERDEFVVLATDGVWDVLSNKEVIDIVSSAPAQASAARTLVDSAVRAWKIKYPTSKVDDCAVVCLFLNSSTSNPSSTTTSPSISKSKIQPAPLDQVNNGDEKQGENSPVVPNGLERSGTTARTCTAEGHPEVGEEEEEALKQPENVLGEEWSALEGVSRLNTMVTLPRFDVDEHDEKMQPAAG
ncbi:Protein phosphatase 2C (PP2C)-like domain [Macleaya cordata]|uniref:protein-serine/threonine phosphatase n=1 Tax=Macleaya cordata TaxID=56857 RepID=A0A200Q713_MACCD|nr:Protein phosphatase 2C (PP2C)-like domain [Macleaya cordata]